MVVASFICRLSVCLSRIRSQKLSERGATFRHVYRKLGSPSKNITSAFAPEVAKYPQKYPAEATILGVCEPNCFAPLAMQLVCVHNACVTVHIGTVNKRRCLKNITQR